MRNRIYSGIEWLGEVPCGWKLERFQWHLNEIKETNSPIKTEQVLSLTNKKGVIPYEEKGAQGNVAKEHYDEYKIAFPGTIVANSMNILIGSVGICNYFGCVSPVYYVFKPTQDSDIEFINYIFQTEPFQKELRKYANGILEIRLRLSSSNILKRIAAFPSLEEQKVIVSYLNKKCGEVDALIANEEAQIEKLKEYKQSLITEVVTKGLDKDVSLKDSFVDSIGQIPVHWDIKKAKYIANAIFKGNGITKEDVVEDGDIQCVRYGELYSKYDISLLKTISHTNIEIIASPQHIHKGDILFACTGELVEEIGKNVVYLGEDPCLAGGDIIVMKHSQNAEFLNYAMYAKCSQIQKSRGKAKLKVVHISSSEIGNIIVALPPIKEQDTIANYLNNRCTEINALISIKQNKISDLKNYKKSLIYEYVTGKKEVNYDTDSN